MTAAPAAEAGVILTVNQDVAGGLTQTGRIDRTGNLVSTCAAPDQAPGSPIVDEFAFRYRNHTLSSRLNEPVCFSVDVNSACPNLYSVAYLGAFDPANPSTRHAGDMGTGVGYPAYSFTVPPGSPISVVIHEVVENAPCTTYSVTFSSEGPWARSRPTIGGDPAVGTVLSGADADWVDSTSLALGRQWRRCDPAGANCADIPGATGLTYTVTDADLGSTIRFRNEATDAEATHSSESDPVEPYIPFDVRAAESLGPGDRVHTGLIVRGAERGRCGAPASVRAIVNPTESYLYDPFGVTSLLNEPVCLVARTVPSCFGVTPTIYNPVFVPAAGLTTNYAAHDGNGFGEVGFVSAPLPAAESREVIVSHQQFAGACDGYSLTLGADAPFALARPAVSGNPVEGGTLNATPGAWSGSPALGYTWLRCDAAGAACVPIEGARDATYRVGVADARSRLRVRVTATQGRSVSSDSAASEVVPLDPAPTGTVRLGSRNLRKAVRSGRVPIRLTCSEACTAAVQLRVARKLARRLKLGRRLVIARAGGPVPAGRPVVLRAKLVKKARKRLRNRKAVRLTIAATFTDSLGKTSRLSREASMKRPKPKRRERPR
jgi:hypothetical protein